MAMQAAGLPRPALGRAPRAARGFAIGCLLLVASLVSVLVDDVHLRHERPTDSAFARAYMSAMVRRDPAGMWATYSDPARRVR